MRKLRTLRSVRVLYPALNGPSVPRIRDIDAIIDCLPPSVTELHLYCKEGTLPLTPATLGHVVEKCGDLRKVYLHTPFDGEAMEILQRHDVRPGIQCVQWTPGDEWD